MEFSDLPGMPVLSARGEPLGYVTQVFLSADLTRLASLVCADGDEAEFVLPARALRGDGTVRAGGRRLDAPAGVPCPVGKPVFSDGGAFLGRVEGISPGNAGVLTVAGRGFRQCYPLRAVSAGEAVIVRSRRRGKEPKAPSAAAAGYRLNLLGRKVAKPLKIGDTLLADAGETVTPRLLQRAREHNRLLELTAGLLTE